MEMVPFSGDWTADGAFEPDANAFMPTHFLRFRGRVLRYSGEIFTSMDEARDTARITDRIIRCMFAFLRMTFIVRDCALLRSAVIPVSIKEAEGRH